MPNYKKIFSGVAIYVGGIMGTYILNLILPTIITAMQTIFNTNTDIEGIIYLGAIIAWIMMIVIMPSVLITAGMKEGTGENRTQEIIMGIIIFIFSLLFTRFAWFWTTTFSTLLAGYTFATVLFWTGLILVWVEITLITPAYLIIKNTQ